MNKSVLWLFLLATAAISSAAVAADISQVASLNLDGTGVALQGYDPVSYHNQGPTKGKLELSLSHDGAVYLFSSRENLETFRAGPEAYLPAFGGWCAWAMLDGEKVEVNAKTYKIIDATTYLFYNAFFTNTLDKWNRRAGEESEAALVTQAQGRWAGLLKTAAPDNEINK